MQCSVIVGFTLGFLETDTTNGCGGAHSYLPFTSPSLGRLSSNSSGQNQVGQTSNQQLQLLLLRESEPFRYITGWLMFGNYAFQSINFFNPLYFLPGSWCKSQAKEHVKSRKDQSKDKSYICALKKKTRGWTRQE